MSNNIKPEQLIVPVYINEKIVIDMLAVIEDGFSKVSQINYTEHKENSSTKNLEAGISTSASIISKLLKIDLKGNISGSGESGENESISKEKIHTNVSLLSKFLDYLVNKKMLKSDFNISKMLIGDFIEVDGELQKNPLINFLDMFIDVFKMAEIFSDTPKLGDKNKVKIEKKEEQKILKQIKSFSDELKHSGTIDFILSDKKGTVVLSVQEQYLSNDNISEILGGNFKILGKVIAICKDSSENINLLRKTTLSILPENMIKEMFSEFQSGEVAQFNLPEFKTKIAGPAVIVIPIAIYA